MTQKETPEKYYDRFKKIKNFVFDVDGVLTDGSLQILSTGELSRATHVKDGYALVHAIAKGYHVAIITGGRSQNVKKRLHDLGIQDVYLGIIDKKETMEEHLLINELKAEETLYMGDDLPDYEALEMVGLPACPADAAPEIKEICSYISFKKGGHGCVREVIEKVLKLRGDWV